MRFTVLGNPDRYLAPLSGGSGYLLEEGDTTILLDCGQGVHAALRQGDVDGMDAVVISHFHFDHCLDLLPVLKAVPDGTPLIVPSGARGNLAAIARAYGFQGHFDAPGPVVEARPGETHTVGDVRLDFAPGKHRVTTMATRARTRNRTLVYLGDTARCEPVEKLAQKADLLVAHTLLPRMDPAEEHARVHLTAETAGALARDVEAKRLLLSHRYWESRDDEMRDVAKEAFENVTLAGRDMVYEIK